MSVAVRGVLRPDDPSGQNQGWWAGGNLGLQESSQNRVQVGPAVDAWTGASCASSTHQPRRMASKERTGRCCTPLPSHPWREGLPRPVTQGPAPSCSPPGAPRSVPQRAGQGCCGWLHDLPLLAMPADPRTPLCRFPTCEHPFGRWCLTELSGRDDIPFPKQAPQASSQGRVAAQIVSCCPAPLRVRTGPRRRSAKRPPHCDLAQQHSRCPAEQLLDQAVLLSSSAVSGALRFWTQSAHSGFSTPRGSANATSRPVRAFSGV